MLAFANRKKVHIWVNLFDIEQYLAFTAITDILYNMFATARRFPSYETVGGLFREVTRNTAELTITERIWEIIIDIVSEIAQCFEIEDEKIFGTLINRSDKLKLLIQIYELKMAS